MEAPNKKHVYSVQHVVYMIHMCIYDVHTFKHCNSKICITNIDSEYATMTCPDSMWKHLQLLRISLSFSLFLEQDFQTSKCHDALRGGFNMGEQVLPPLLGGDVQEGAPLVIR